MAAAFLKGEPVEGEITVITAEQAKEADYNLSPSRWVSPVSGEGAGDLGEILTRYEAALREEASASDRLREALRKLRTLA